MARVYISSTYSDLIEFRKVAVRAADRLDCHVIAMEKYVATDERPLEKCLRDVRDCELYVGIIGWRYGFRPVGKTKSITQLEYECARDAGIPCLLFLAEADADWPDKWRDAGEDAAAVEAFRSEVSERHTVSFFSSPGQLETLVTAAISLQLRPATSELRIPELLPYMSDRSQQRDQLADAIDAHHETRPQRPLVVFVHGDEPRRGPRCSDRGGTSRSQSLEVRARQSELQAHGSPHERDVAVSAEMTGRNPHR